MRRVPGLFWVLLAVILAYTIGAAASILPRSSPPVVLAAGAGWFALMLAWQFVYRARPELAATRGFAALAWAGSIALGAWATYVLLSLPFDLFSLVHAVDPRRPLLLAAAAGALAALGAGQALAGPRVERVRVPLEGLDPRLDGLKIVQLSDLHVGPTIRARYVERVARAAQELSPDLIALTGDLADGPPAGLADQMKALGALRAPLGVFYVTGNHEYYWGGEAWLETARALGFTPLVDEGKIVERGGARVLVAGVPDPQGRHFVPSHRGDIKKAAADGGGAALRVLLAHRPDAADAAEAAGFDLQLSGHTHGGQFFPFSLIVRLAHRYARGLHRHGRLWVYVNRGAGYWGPPHRFAVPAEVTLLTLARG